MKLTDRKAIGAYYLSNWGGVEILAINHGIDDTVDWRYYDLEEGTSKIEYDNDGRPFFVIGENLKIYLDECLKVGR